MATFTTTMQIDFRLLAAEDGYDRNDQAVRQEPTVWEIYGYSPLFKGTYTDDWYGTEFTYSAQSGFPNAGTVTGYSRDLPSRGSLRLDGASVFATTIVQYLQVQHSAGLVLAAMLAGNDSVTGSPFNDYIAGYSGNDRMDGGLGKDTMVGGAGDDTYIVDDPLDLASEAAGAGLDSVSLLLAAGKYVLPVNVEDATVAESSGALAVTGNSLNNRIVGNALANVLDGASAADTLVGGAGDDTYYVDNLGDTTVEAATEGTDSVLVSLAAGIYLLRENIEIGTLAGAAAAGLTGNAQANTLTGNGGANVLDGGGEADLLIGGGGGDTYVVDHAGDVVREITTLATEVDLVKSWLSFDLADNGNGNLRDNLEHLTLLGDAAINGSGNAKNNTLTGNGAGNTLFGAAGNDSLVGNGGADSLDGGVGNDSMSGGDGNDTYIVDSLTDIVTESSALAAGGVDEVRASVSHVLKTNVEDLLLTGAGNLNGTGNSLANRLTGNSGKNLLDGGTGLDSLAGGLGDDSYVLDQEGELALLVENADAGADLLKLAYSNGSPLAKRVDLGQTHLQNIENVTLAGTGIFNIVGNDRDNALIGNASANQLEGGAGNDSLNGGGGADTLVGGAGDDGYYVDNLNDIISEAAAAGRDSVSVTLAAGSYLLRENIEGGVLLGTAAVGLTGNALANTLIGNVGANLLDGAGDADILAGGAGGDTYVIDSVGDIVQEASAVAAEIDLVKSVVSFDFTDNSNGNIRNNLEHLTLLGDAAINGTGNDKNNTLTGNGAGNVLSGGAGNDSLVGNGGADSLDGGSGNDSMSGGDGNDTYIVDSATDIVTESSALAAGGVDEVRASINYVLKTNVENLLLTGTGNLNGTGNTLANRLSGNSGNNLLDGGTGLDSLAGGLGDDSYVLDQEGELALLVEMGDAGSDWLKLGYNNSSLVAKQIDLSQPNLQAVENVQVAGTGLFTILGNGWANTLIGNASANRLEGGAGDDTLNGGAGADTLVGGTGNDSYTVDNVGDVITEAADGGRDTVVVALAAGSYTLRDNVENGTLTGTAATSLTGSAVANVLTGNGAANVLDGAGEADILIGGGGGDTYVVDHVGDVVLEATTLATEVDLVKSWVSFDLADNSNGNSRDNLEHLTLLGEAAINGSGNAKNNTLTGNGAGNVLSGGAGNDSLVGNGGADSLDGGSGNDSMSGGDGNDTYIVDSATDIVTESNALAAGGVDEVRASLSYVLKTNVENLLLTGTGNFNGTGNTLANSLTGNSGNNLLDGGTGLDSLAGGLGNDSYVLDQEGELALLVENADGGSDLLKLLYSNGSLLAKRVDLGQANLQNVENVQVVGTGPFNLTGNDRANNLIGNASANQLDGGAGNDTLTGGGGSDRFHFSTAPDAVSNVDRISDFVSAIDRFMLESSAFGNLPVGTLPASAFVAGRGVTVATSTEQRIIYDLATGALYWDADGNALGATAVAFAQLTTKPVLRSSDFQIYSAS